MIEEVLIIDTETTDLDPSKGRLIEIGAILYSVKHQITVQQASTLIPAASNPAEKFNRIPLAPLLEMSTEVSRRGIASIEDMARNAELVVAHNADFDRQWFEDSVKREVTLPKLVDSCGKPLHWVCTCYDFEWPKQTRPGQSLVDLALAHGIGVYNNHRALTDCQLIASLFDVMEDLQGMFDKALRPKARYIAKVSYEEKELAKQAGFKWVKTSKTWERYMAVEDTQNLPFSVRLADLSVGAR